MYMYSHIIAKTMTEVSPGGLPTGDANQAMLETVLSIVFGIIGALALLIITVSGLRYITAAGDPQKISNAKNGVVYALVGLIIAILAQVIVSFVVKRL